MKKKTKKSTCTALTKPGILEQAITDSYGNISTIAKRLGVSRTTIYKYLDKNQDLRDRIDSEREVAIDFAESQLMEKIKSGDTVSIIFFLKTQGRRRGYSERYQIEGNFPLQISFIEDLKD